MDSTFYISDYINSSPHNHNKIDIINKILMSLNLAAIYAIIDLDHRNHKEHIALTLTSDNEQEVIILDLDLIKHKEHIVLTLELTRRI